LSLGERGGKANSLIAIGAPWTGTNLLAFMGLLGDLRAKVR